VRAARSFDQPRHVVHPNRTLSPTAADRRQQGDIGTNGCADHHGRADGVAGEREADVGVERHCRGRRAQHAREQLSPIGHNVDLMLATLLGAAYVMAFFVLLPPLVFDRH